MNTNYEIQKLKQQIIELEQSSFPSTEYELSRRRIRQNVDDLWHFLNGKLNSSVMQFVNELRYNLLIDFDVLEKRDNQWREKQRKNLSDFIQQKIQVLQNPIDCKSAKKLVCDGHGCGFGCQMHYMVNCFLAAIALNPTLVVKLVSFVKGYDVWKPFFQPISRTCLDWSGDNETEWTDGKNVENYQVVYFYIFYSYEPRPYFAPQVIPQQISQQLIRLSGEPFVWFIGQLLKYLMSPSDKVQTFIDEFKKKINFNHPIVAIQIRRTDKIVSEAKYHSIDEYMYFVEDFYNKIDFTNERNGVNKTAERLVYLATDEPQVWKTEIQKYIKNGYTFLGNVNSSLTASADQRLHRESYHSLVVDLILLSECDFVVCTFSSNICRLAFELMQIQESGTDLSNGAHSLDQFYFFDGQTFHGKVALMSHWARNGDEISFQAGDILGTDFKFDILFHFESSNKILNSNEYIFGIHNKTKKSGIYPRFKVTDLVESRPFAMFGDFDI